MLFVRSNFIATMELVIYNRWGEKVFSTTDQSIGWDGTYKGQLLSPDVFGYYLTVMCPNEETYTKREYHPLALKTTNLMKKQARNILFRVCYFLPNFAASLKGNMQEESKSWYQRLRHGIQTATKSKKETPDGLWYKCEQCNETSTVKTSRRISTSA